MSYENMPRLCAKRNNFAPMSDEGTQRYTVIYRHGLAVGINPPPQGEHDIRDYAYNATKISIDGVIIDLLKSDDIMKIDTNISIEPSSSSVGRLDNNLRFQAFHLRQCGYHEQSVEVLEKACSIMENYPTWWKPNTFFTLPEWLYEDGRDEEALTACKYIRTVIEKYSCAIQNNATSIQHDLLKECASLGTDWVVINYQHTCCEECAKYRSRIYSLSGKDKRFPALPDRIKKASQFHNGCTCLATPTLTIRVTVGMKNGATIDLWDDEAIKYSNRPFEDDRTEEEKSRYLEWKSRQDRTAEEQKYVGFEERVRKSGKNKRMYRFICEYLPDSAPGSYNAYMRMKKQRTKTYLYIEKQMNEIGVNIEIV